MRESSHKSPSPSPQTSQTPTISPKQRSLPIYIRIARQTLPLSPLPKAPSHPYLSPQSLPPLHRCFFLPSRRYPPLTARKQSINTKRLFLTTAFLSGIPYPPDFPCISILTARMSMQRWGSTHRPCSPKRYQLFTGI